MRRIRLERADKECVFGRERGRGDMIEGMEEREVEERVEERKVEKRMEGRAGESD